jgi:DNA helicase-2/ATP-dependent DNA helicase PcrA
MAVRLTDEQVLAAASNATLVNIISGPGSGKTTVSAARFGYLHHRDPDGRRGVLGLSFTRSAVGELRSRIAARWGYRAVELPNLVTTFDDFHVRVLHHLLDLGLVTWPTGHKRLDVIDDFRGVDGDYRWLIAGSYRRYAGCGADGVITSCAERITKPKFGFGKKEPHLTVLSSGTSSHDDVRRALRMALKHVPGAPAAVIAWLAASYRHVVVDEIYDADELDIFTCRCVAEAKTATLTLVGDPWQALYDWRGATPEKVGTLLLDSYPFAPYQQQRSFRFATQQTIELARALRAGESVTVPLVASTAVDVALGRNWTTLWTVGDNVLPLAFRTVGNRVDAALNLLLDEVTRMKLGRESFGRQSALVHLGMPEEGIEEVLREHFRPILAELVAGLPAVDVLERLRDAAEIVSPRSRPSRLKATAEAQRVQEIERLRLRLDRFDLIPGLTVYQAKGCEWSRVGVALTATHEAALTVGLTNAQEEDCVVYVALTRAKDVCGILTHDDQLDFADGV